MVKKITWGIMIMVLTAGVLLGAYLGLARFLLETQNRVVMVVVDLNDLKKMAAYEKKPLTPILEEIRKLGFVGIGEFEETLPEANVNGELYCVKGTGIERIAKLFPPFKSLIEGKKIKAQNTYLYIPEDKVRQRVFHQLRWVLGEKAVRFLGKEVLEIEEAEEELRPLGIGLSESTHKFLVSKGFIIVPRVWNDPRYHLGNIEEKISGLAGHDLIIFDGEEVLGYPFALPALAGALKKYGIQYGYLEIVKQDGDQKLRRLMQEKVVRVHSVPKDELEKLTKEEALDRFVRAARERGVRLLYLRPFLPPQIDGLPVSYNLKYFRELKEKLEQAGFILGKVERFPKMRVKGWQILVLGLGVVVGGMLLLNLFVDLPLWLIYLLFFGSGFAIVLLGVSGQNLLLQKVLSFSAATIFPTYAVLATFSKGPKFNAGFFWGTILLIINMVMETAVGIFLMIGLLADTRFMLGVETFPAVKLALIFPPLLVGTYLFLKAETGTMKVRIQNYLATTVTLGQIFWFLLIAAVLGVLVGRSGNFLLPVPTLEKHLRSWLEILLWVRPRTKEFLLGYPFLFLAGFYFLKGQKKWLWLLAGLGTIALVSVFNSFSHIHTPLVISIIRTFNGLVLGLALAVGLVFIVERFVKKE